MTCFMLNHVTADLVLVVWLKEEKDEVKEDTGDIFYILVAFSEGGKMLG